MNEISTYPICLCISEFLRLYKDNLPEDSNMENKNILTCNEHLKVTHLDELLKYLEEYYKLKYIEFKGELMNELQNSNINKRDIFPQFCIIIKDKNRKLTLENSHNFNRNLRRIDEFKRNFDFLNLQRKYNIPNIIDVISEVSDLSKKKEEKTYSQCLKEMFIKFTDIRKNFLERILIEDNIEIESFLIHLQTLVFFFTGLSVKYYIDFYDNINLEIYSDFNNLVNIAKHISYYFQIRILNYSISISAGEEFNNDKLKEKNKRQFEEFTMWNPTYFPPYYSLNSTRISLLRVYEESDKYHFCEEDFKRKKCLDEVSIFRNIDKERLVFFTISDIFDFRKMHSNLNSIILDNFIMKNYRCYEKDQFKLFNVLLSYSYPIYTKKSIALTQSFRNFYGENVGFYFLWLSHYLKWLTLASSITIFIIFFQLLFYFSTINLRYFDIYSQLLFSCLLIAFGNFYINSWKQTENFYRYIWGMESYKQHQKIRTINENENFKFLNLIIPKSNGALIQIKRLICALTTIALTIISSALYMILIYIQHLNLFAKPNSPIGNENIYQIQETPLVYFMPLIMSFTRDILKWGFKRLAKLMIKYEDHHSKESLDRSMSYKNFFFNFFNYYYSFYYIAFFKIYFEDCIEKDCLHELRINLYIYFAKDTLHQIYKICQAYFFLIPKKFYEISSDDNMSNKYFFYSRERYYEEIFDDNHMHFILYFGYLIQFGSASPILLIIALVQVYLGRLTNAIQFTQIYYFDTINGSKGIGLFTLLIRILIFLGLIVNASLVVFTNTTLAEASLQTKLLILLIVENIVIFFLFFMRINVLPKWFNYKDIIELEYKTHIHKKSYPQNKTNFRRINTI